MSRPRTDFIVIHCSATKPSQDVDAREIDRWHRRQGWLKIGYHWVIKRDGTLETGRLLSEAGAHVKGYNDRSIGICMVGGVAEASGKPESNFTPAQWETLEGTVVSMLGLYPRATVVGHRDLSPDLNGNGKVEPNEYTKACPSFDVKQWWAARAH